MKPIRLALLAAALILAELPGQGPANPPNTSGKKVLTYNQAQFWPANVVLFNDAALWAMPQAHSFAGGAQLLQANVNDVAVLPSLTPGAPERVITVGAQGARAYLWQTLPAPAAGQFTSYVFASDQFSNLAGATAVRAASFFANGQEVGAAAFRRANGHEIEIHRVGAVNQYLTAWPAGAPILDFEFVLNGSGVPVLLVRTDTQILCKSMAGGDGGWTSPVALPAGSPGDFVRVAGRSAWQSDWLYRNGAQWQLLRFGAAGPVSATTVPLPDGAASLKAFGVQATSDACTDLVVKTATQLSILHGSHTVVGSLAFGSQQTSLAVFPSPSSCEPDLVVTQGGQIVQVADHSLEDGLEWIAAPTPADSLRRGGAATIALSSVGAHEYQVIDFVSANEVELRIPVRITTELFTLAPVDGEKHLQVVTWRMGFSPSISLLPAGNTVHPLENHTGTGATWRPSIRLAGTVSSLTGNPVYHIHAVRVLVGATPQAPTWVSDAFMFGSTFSRDHKGEPPPAMPLLANFGILFEGPLRGFVEPELPPAGDPLGVISKVNIGPPPPASALPAPSTASVGPIAPRLASAPE